MQITLEWLKEKNACADGVEWFQRNFPAGGGYQAVLDALAHENLSSWGSWLLSTAGPAGTVLKINGDYEAHFGLYFAGRVEISESIKVAGHFLAGSGIKAGSGIEAGEDFAIYAGLSVRLSLKAKYALVIAKTKPSNLLLGEFREVGASLSSSK